MMAPDRSNKCTVYQVHLCDVYLFLPADDKSVSALYFQGRLSSLYCI